ncbi:MAG TPA: hypothetical protein VNN80_06330 [Polyangiaceae bacterium]|nr:hypothetical protein [Polyangiaceae bacterium]
MSPPPGPRTVRLSYLAPSDCPTVDGYLSHVRARSTNLRLEERELPGAGDSVDVRLDPDLAQPGWLGQLRIEGSKPLERDVRGERCEDVVAALALITVLRLEGSEAATTAAPAGAPGGQASGGAGQAGGEATGAASAAGVGAAAAASAAASAAPSPEPSARPAAPAPNPSEPAAAPEPTPSNTSEPPPAEGRTEVDEARGPSADSESPGPAPLRPESVAAASAAGGNTADEPPLEPDEPLRVPRSEPLAPSTSDAGARSEPSAPLRARLAPTLAVLVGYASEPADALELALQGELRYGDTFDSWASPLSLTFAYASERVDEADLRFSLLTAQLGVCPPPLGEAWAWLRVCGNVRGGGVVVKVSPRIAGDPESTALRPWLAVGPSLELGVPLSERWSLRGVGELAVQLVRDRFGPEIEGDGGPEFVPLYDTKPVSLEAGLGVGYSF